jgi:hypothetical protein
VDRWLARAERSAFKRRAERSVPVACGPIPAFAGVVFRQAVVVPDVQNKMREPWKRAVPIVHTERRGGSHGGPRRNFLDSKTIDPAPRRRSIGKMNQLRGLGAGLRGAPCELFREVELIKVSGSFRPRATAVAPRSGWLHSQTRTGHDSYVVVRRRSQVPCGKSHTSGVMHLAEIAQVFGRSSRPSGSREGCIHDRN